MKKTILLLLLLTLSLCGFAKKKKAKLVPNIDGTYILVSLKVNDAMIQNSYDRSRLTFDTKNKLVSCYMGCNSIAGTLIVHKDKIDPMKIMMTEMFCEDNHDNLEMRFTNVLGKVNRFKLKKDVLELYANDELVLVAKRNE